MKELSIEEKAKAYDEAIKVAKSKIKNDKDHVLYEEDITDIFPELRESEDERIRKEIMRFIFDYPQKLANRDSWLAWLEKQGEKEYSWSEESDDDAWLNDIVSKVEYGLQLNKAEINWLKSIKEKLHKEIHYWTEEEIEPIISDYLRGTEHYGGMIGRLRCLKPKALEKQDEQEAWSEEDKKMLKWVIEYLNNRVLNTPISEERTACKNAIAWLKDIKDRVQPQSQWKPSDEQMKGIECAIKTLQHQLNVGDKRLNSLYDALKKLKG